jgi:hypothetical protein
MNAKLRASADLAEVTAEFARKHAEDDVLRARLPESDERRPLLDALVRALEARTFDDSALTLEAELRDLHEHEQTPSRRPLVPDEPVAYSPHRAEAHQAKPRSRYHQPATSNIAAFVEP